MSDIARRYPANVFWSDEDAGFVAIAPDLPGCSALGETKSEALSELDQAISAWIEAANAAGNPIPEPSRPSLEAQPSGKLLVRMPRSLHASLAQAAKRENVSLNHYVVFLLTTARVYRALGDAIAHAFWEPHKIVRVTLPESGRSIINPVHHLTTTKVISTTEWNEGFFG